MGIVIDLPSYAPRIPRDHDTELSIQADLMMLEKIQRWAVAQKTACVREAKPLAPAIRLMVFEASDALEL
jgi:hypothetical protein